MLLEKKLEQAIFLSAVGNRKGIPPQKKNQFINSPNGFAFDHPSIGKRFVFLLQSKNFKTARYDVSFLNYILS